MAHGVLATQPELLTATSTDDAWFRKFKNVADALTAMGMVKTADTGQVDWATVTKPVGGDESVFEIRRFSDAMQATAPVFFKVIYFYSTGTTAAPTIRILVGTGSTGSGSLVNQIPDTNLYSALSMQSTLRTWFYGGDTSGFAFLTGSAANIARMFTGFERARKADGSPSSRYVLFYSAFRRNLYTTSVYYDDPTLTVLDLQSQSANLPDTLPIPYWRDLSVVTKSLALGNSYPFGVMQIPTQEGLLRNKLFVGAAYNDFADGTILAIPRFSGKIITKYRLELKESSSSGGAFGPSPSGVASTNNDTPSAYAMPAIFWD